MTTNPEQADTVPPLSDDELAKVRALAEEGFTDLTTTRYRGSSLSVLRLLGMYDRAMADLAAARRQRDEARDNHQSALDEQVRLERELLRTRRQRDDRPAGRVLAKAKTMRPLNAKPGEELHQSCLAYVFVDAPEGTEVAVVVVADDSAQSTSSTILQLDQDSPVSWVATCGACSWQSPRLCYLDAAAAHEEHEETCPSQTPQHWGGAVTDAILREPNGRPVGPIPLDDSGEGE